MNPKERAALNAATELLEQIRGIAGDAIQYRHVSRLGYGKFDCVSACKEIYILADAAHNVPRLIADQGGEVLAPILDRQIQRMSDAYHDLFGDTSRYLPPRNIEKYSTIKDRGLHEDLQAYFFEVRQASESRRRRHLHKMVLKGVAALIIGTILFSVFKPWSFPVFQGNKVVILDKATTHPATALINAAQDMMEKTKPGQVYNVKITVEAM